MSKRNMGMQNKKQVCENHVTSKIFMKSWLVMDQELPRICGKNCYVIRIENYINIITEKIFGLTNSILTFPPWQNPPAHTR